MVGTIKVVLIRTLSAYDEFFRDYSCSKIISPSPIIIAQCLYKMKRIDTCFSDYQPAGVLKWKLTATMDLNKIKRTLRINFYSTFSWAVRIGDETGKNCRNLIRNESRLQTGV